MSYDRGLVTLKLTRSYIFTHAEHNKDTGFRSSLGIRRRGRAPRIRNFHAQLTPSSGQQLFNPRCDGRRCSIARRCLVSPACSRTGLFECLPRKRKLSGARSSIRYGAHDGQHVQYVLERRSGKVWCGKYCSGMILRSTCTFLMFCCFRSDLAKCITFILKIICAVRAIVRALCLVHHISLY